MFIKSYGFSKFDLALCAIGLATTAMSCADTVATSGASCITRDLFKRYMKSEMDDKKVMMINRMSVLFLIIAATICSYFIKNIIEAIHIATFIASSAYFFSFNGELFTEKKPPGKVLLLGFMWELLFKFY